MRKRIAIIGCGASGMMAALAAAQAGGDVTVYEKNDKPGKKLFITGKGRCNVTNACDDLQLLDNIRVNPRFMYSAIYGYDNTAVMEFFQKNGCVLKIERGERVFPESDHSSDIIKTLVTELKKLHVRIQYGFNVSKIGYKADAVHEIISDKGKEEAADAVIICTGGCSYPSTGSTGDGYRLAQEAGHTVTDRTPSLVPLVVSQDWCRKLQGLSLKNVSVKLIRQAKKNKVVYEGFGEMLFTHFGVSGPLILTASTYYEEKTEMLLEIDLKPALSPEQLDRRLLRDFGAELNRQFSNSLGALLPSKLIPVIIELSGIAPDRKINDITREERLGLVKLIKGMSLTVTGTRGFDEAIITRGGISVKEINPSTMESKIKKGLFFAGEVIDTDALTGGFNLQIAWSTGHLAGEAAAME